MSLAILYKVHDINFENDKIILNILKHQLFTVKCNL